MGRQSLVEGQGVTRVAPHSPSEGCFLRPSGATRESRGRHARAPALLSWLAPCSAPVATDLEEAAANRVVAALGRNGIAADKQRDPEQEGRFSVDVGRADASFALGVMAREELPPEQAPGFSDAFGQSSFIPSRSDEQ